MENNIDNIFAFGAQQQTESYNRIASYKEKQAAHELLTAQIQHENAQLSLQHTKLALRPTMMLRPLVAQIEKEWTVAFGDCIGRGPTPDLAAQAFDDAWIGKQEE